ncbi:MAG TPA: J domain-containing protein [Fastidiosipila sp.]|nr:J domain-containing protein [Fastidiosipila sp.]
MNKDPYEILGVRRGATQDEIRAAYRELVKKYHPDNYQNHPLGELAEEKIKEINWAYDQLTNGNRQQQTGGQGQGYGQSGPTWYGRQTNQPPPFYGGGRGYYGGGSGGCCQDLACCCLADSCCECMGGDLCRCI